jgi:hypothetical protein
VEAPAASATPAVRAIAIGSQGLGTPFHSALDRLVLRRV